MMLFQARPIAVIIAASICLAGCDRLGVFPARTDNGRYQLMKDGRGQTLRLDTVTGSIVIVDPSTIPVERSSARRGTPSGATVPAPAAVPEVQPTQDTPVETTEKPAEDAPAVDSRTSETPTAVASACAQIGEPAREFVLSSQADAFVDPGRPSPPVASLATGTPVQGVNVEGTWLLVRFRDQVWGERSAYISCASVLARTDGPGRGRPTN